MSKIGAMAGSMTLCIVIAACPSTHKSVPSPSGTPFARRTPVEIFNAALDAARGAGSLRAIAMYGDGPGDVYDIGTTSGMVRIDAEPDLMYVRVVGDVAYAKGNQGALTEILGSSKSVAKRYANHWIQFSHDDDHYLDLVDSVTMSSFIDDIGFSGAIVKYAPSTLNGKKVIGLSGPLTVGGRGTLYISLEGSPLPVELVSTEQNAQRTVDFSRWGEPINVSAPAGAIGASTIGL